MTSPCIHIAIPTFNGSRYLEHTLRSLTANRRFVKWWLQDGGSEDGTLQIANLFKSEADTIVSEPDGGQADALNKAFGKMGGEIVGYLNADDSLCPRAAEAVAAFFEANPDVDLVFGQVEWIDETGAVTGHHAGRIASIEDILDIYNVWWRGRQWVQPEVFWRRSLWERVGPFNTRYHLAFDFDYWVRCFKAGAQVAHIPRPLAQFRIHASQKSADSQRAADEIRDIVTAHLGPECHLPRQFRRRLAREIRFDRYQLGQLGGSGGSRPGLLQMVLRHPDWFLLPQVRTRMWNKVFRRRK